MISSDEAVYRKLLADGEGTGEDKRFQLLFSAIINSLGKEGDPGTAGDTRVFSRVLSLLDQVELSLLKHGQCANVHEAEAAQNEELFKEIDSLIESHTQRIETVKEELAAARLVRRNRQEYDVLARVIKERPSRAETQRKLKELQDQMSVDLESQQMLEQKLADRKKNIYALALLLNILEQQPDADSNVGGEPSRSEQPTTSNEAREDEERTRNSPMDISEACRTAPVVEEKLSKIPTIQDRR